MRHGQRKEIGGQIGGMATVVAVHVFRIPFGVSPSSSYSAQTVTVYFRRHCNLHSKPAVGIPSLGLLRGRKPQGLSFAGDEDTELQVSTSKDEDDLQEDPTPEDLEYVSQIRRVLELLRKNRNMLFGEPLSSNNGQQQLLLLLGLNSHQVKLTIMIEDPREDERRSLLGIADSDVPTRDDLAAALEEVNEGRVPKNREALRMLAEEMMQWPSVEVEAPKKKRSRSLYAKATDTGVDPQVAAKRLNIDWDSAAEIDDDVSDEPEVPAAVGYGVLYLVTAFPIVIGIAVVLILFYNSLR
ncbi:ycf3-interacting protein 1, chloroplastic isoform X1 [Malania oleifera]|uniref:ycf3-interacting protein 1, chloroplastic isoform X1 n=1 Tax=Malania oleifera TaxID=397392 RepID=UPI0025ADAACF|nr:ycf3-interacting protein 1, chloroplastic isoform X1 [Malania oleifera]